MRQKAPETLDVATLELESYLSPNATIAAVPEPEMNELTSPTQIGAVSANCRDLSNPKLVILIEKLVDRAERLEAGTHRPGFYEKV